MKRIITIFVFTFMLILLSSGNSEITVMDEFDLLTPDEAAEGVLLDPDTLFAYKILADGSVAIVRYAWFKTQIDIYLQIF